MFVAAMSVTQAVLEVASGGLRLPDGLGQNNIYHTYAGGSTSTQKDQNVLMVKQIMTHVVIIDHLKTPGRSEHLEGHLMFPPYLKTPYSELHCVYSTRACLRTLHLIVSNGKPP